MKRLILASILCLLCAIALRGQDPPLSGGTHYRLLKDWTKLGPSLWPPGFAGMDWVKLVPQQRLWPYVNAALVPGSLPEMAAPPPRCSVRLLEVPVGKVDEKMMIRPSISMAPMPQVRLPAPPCPK